MKKLAILFLAAISLISCNQANSNKEKENTNNTSTEVAQRNIVVDNILNRRSIRKYKTEQVSQSQLDTIIKCGIYAPSALNKQSWEIRVIQNSDLLNKINTAFINDAKGKSLPGSASKAQEPGFSVFHNAPTLIVVAKDNNNAYSPVDCGLLSQNILLSAESMNLGTCVVGSVANILNTDKELKSALNLPNNYEVLLGIAIGYKDESPAIKERDTQKVQYIK